MVIKVGDKFIGIIDRRIYECIGVSKYGTLVAFKYNDGTQEVIISFNFSVAQIEGMIRSKEWAPDTPAGRVLYGHETRER